MSKEAIEIDCKGCGTRFRLWIPTELLSSWGDGEEINCVNCAVRFLIKKSDKTIQITELSSDSDAGGDDKADSAEGTKPTHHILFVDDDKLSAAVAEHALEGTPVAITSTTSGEAALDIFKEGDFDLIVTDLHLVDPEDPNSRLDGEDLLREIADIAIGKEIPAIIMTGKDLIDDIAMDPKWFDLRVKGFIQKGNPFWAEEMKTKIKEILNILESAR